MKPLKGDQQLRSVSLPYSVGAPGGKSKILSTKKKRVLDASTDPGLTERGGEVSLLDILSHRMSVNAFHEKAGQCQQRFSFSCFSLSRPPLPPSFHPLLDERLFARRQLGVLVSVGAAT